MKKEDVIKRMSDFMIPKFYKKMIIKKYGVTKYLKECARDVKVLRKDQIYFYHLAYKLSPEEFCNFISNYRVISFDDYYELDMITHIKEFKEISKYIQKDLLNDVLKKGKREIFDLSRVVKEKEKEAILIIDEAINQLGCLKCLDIYENEWAIKRIVDSMDIDTIIYDIKRGKISREYCTAVFSVRHDEIKKYILNDINISIENISDYFPWLFPYEFMEEIVKEADIEKSTLKDLLIRPGNLNTDFEIALHKYRKDLLYSCIDEIIAEKRVIELSEKYFINDIQNYIIKNVPKDEMLDLIYNPNTISAIKKEICSNKKLVVELVLLESNDINKVFEYIADIGDEEIGNEILKRMSISRDYIKKLVDDMLVTRLIKVYKVYREEVINVLLEVRINTPDTFFRVISYMYDEKLVESVTHNLSDDELLIVFGSYTFVSSCCNLIYKKNKERLINLCKKLLTTNEELLKNILSKYQDSLLRNDMISFLPVEWLMKSDILSFSNKVDLYNKRPLEFQEYLLEQYNTDKVGLFKQTFLYYNSMDSYCGYIYSLYTKEDLFALLKENGKNCVISTRDHNSIMYRDIEKIVMEKSEFLALNDWDEYILLLKGIRTLDDDLFAKSLNFLNSFDFLNNNGEIIDKLFIERGLSDSQKAMLFEKYHDEILRIVLQNISIDRKNAINYLQKGTPNEVLRIVLDNITKEELKELLSDEKFVSRRSVGKNFAIKLFLFIFKDRSDVEIAKKCLNVYLKDKFKFVKNFEIIQRFLKEFDINPEDFWECCLNNSYDYLDDFVNIYNNNLHNFKLLVDLLMESDDNCNNISFYSQIINLARNFNRYEELCLSICQAHNINDEIKNNIFVLFNRDEILEYKPKDLEECKNINILIKNNFMEMYEKAEDLESIKNLIFRALFNAETQEMENKISDFGSTASLLELKHYHPNDVKINKMIDELIGYTALIEDILGCDDLDDIKKVAKRVVDNIDTIMFDLNFSNYDKKMNELYAYEMSISLTKIDSCNKRDFVLNKTESEQYGVDVYNFYDKQYALLAHVLSDREDVGELVNGISRGDRAFISFSSISHRNQAYYYGAHNIIFGYDDLPPENFIFSSVNNMATNGAIKTNSTEVTNIARTQRGTLEISDTDGNSEVLCLRKGLKPKYIIVPMNRKPTGEEIAYAKKFGLIICKTQYKNKMIDDPVAISSSDESVKDTIYTKEVLENMKRIILSTKAPSRKIAVITDIHGLLEPAISVLESIRKNGITEIYSLGDNIGIGPDSKEVLDLLKMYGVKSIKGNHEIYLENMNLLKEHLVNTGAYNEETLNRDFIEASLSDEQKREIKEFPTSIELEIGGKKVLLCHYINDYNTEKLAYDIDKYDAVIYGHRHFEGSHDNCFVLKSVGVGNKSIEDVGTATYAIVSIQDGQIDYNLVKVKYDYKNAIDSVNKSKINTKKKMISWIGSKK